MQASSQYVAARTAVRHPLDLDASAPSAIARWRPLLNWLLVLPLGVWLLVLQIGSGALAFLAWFAVLLNGTLPRSWTDYFVGVLRYQWRVTAYLYGWAAEFPGFAVSAGGVDPGDYPATLFCSHPARRNRWTVLARSVLSVPPCVALAVVGCAAAAALVAGWFAVLVTGRWPAGLRRFAIGYFRWTFRVQAFLLLVVDAYPPFSLSP